MIAGKSTRPAKAKGPRASGKDQHAVFEALKQILARHAADLSIVKDEPGHYYLDAHIDPKTHKPTFFGATRIMKSYVSYYLMPVYVFPELLEGLSPELKKRMQGKSCFNFSAPDPALFAELAALTDRGFDRYKHAGMLVKRL